MTEKPVTWDEVEIEVSYGILRGKTCTVNGGTSEIDKDALHIVALHGWLDNCNTFDNIVPLLPSGTKVLTLDLPGHGLSDHLPLGAQHNPIVYACNVYRALLSFGWKEFIFMGHSLGAAICCIFTSLFPEHVKGIINFDFLAPGSLLPFVDVCRESAKQLIKAEQLAHEPPIVYSETEAIERLVAARLFRGSRVPTIDKEAAQILLPRSAKEFGNGYIWNHDYKARASFLCFYQGENWLETIAAIKCPVLLVLATKGAGAGGAHIIKMCEEAYKKDAKLFQYECVKGTHHVHLIDPICVIPCVLKFLENVVNESQMIYAKL